MADATQYEPPAIQKFLATRRGTALKMLFSIVASAFGIAEAVAAHRHGSAVGTGFGAAVTLGGAMSAFRHAGVLSGRVAPEPPGPKMVSVATFATRDEARRAAARLKAVGVGSVVAKQTIVVRARDAERARLLLGVPPPTEL